MAITPIPRFLTQNSIFSDQVGLGTVLVLLTEPVRARQRAEPLLIFRCSTEFIVYKQYDSYKQSFGGRRPDRRRQCVTSNVDSS